MERDEEIFAAAVPLSPAERNVLLAQACGNDPARRREIEALLRAHDSAQGFMQAPVLPRSGTAAVEAPGDVIDRYTLLQRIGEGGVGVVWMAQQEAPLRRQVALKVVKRGMDTDAVVARFEGEREALARMDHPSIARVFDAGATASGRPYFVMELVRGTPITRYCDDHHLTTAQRLELFIAVCEAVQHAHQKGVIHRDLKPSNILVTENGGVPLPKVIDFGIAKATQGQLGVHSVFTAFEHFIGTPTYMSPEQAGMNSLDLDTRSDVYSLGVLLFELLTGQTPFDRGEFLAGGIDRIRQRIREDEPARPSARISELDVTSRTTLARQRGIAPTQLALDLRGDLDWIVLRCLEKDRTRRYDSASALAADLRRYLRHEPVAARPPSRRYVLGKMIRRHRAGFAAAAVGAIAILTGGGVSAWQAVRATRAEREQVRLRAIESELRREAQEREQAARRRAYAADINLAQQALANDNLGLAKRLLARQRPAPDQPDLRGWEWLHLRSLAQSEAAGSLREMPFPVSSLSVSADGHWMALGQSEGGELVVSNVQTRQEIRLPAGVGAVRATFSPVAPLLAVAFTAKREPEPEHRLLLWDHVRREVVATWTSPTPPGPLFFSADGTTLATTGSRASGATVWRVPSGERVAGGVGGRESMMAFDRAFRQVAREVSGGGRGRVQVIDWQSGMEHWSGEVSREGISALAFSDDGTVVAAAGGNTHPVITVWEARSGRLLHRLEGHRSYITSLLFWPDGRRLASAGTDQTIRIWDIATGELRRTFRGHELEVHSLALLRDGTTLVSGAKDGAVLLWDTGAPFVASRAKIEGVTGWRFAPDGASVVMVMHDGRVVRRGGVDFSDTSDLLRLEAMGPPARVAFAPEAPRLAAPHGGDRVRIVDWRDGRVVGEIATGGQRTGVLGFSADGTRVLLAQEGPGVAASQVQEWDVASGRRLRAWDAARVPAPYAGAATDGRWLTVRGLEALTLVDLNGTLETRVPLSAEADVGVGGVAPGGRRLALTSTVGWVRVWDRTRGEVVAELSGFVLGVHGAAFSPDGDRLLTGSGGAEAVRVWDAISFEPLLTLEAEGTRFGSVSFSPDGTMIGARNGQGQLFLWRPALATSRSDAGATAR